MILLALGAAVMTFGLPELIKRMDPEMRAEFEESQRKGPMAGLMGAAAGGKAPGGDFDAAGWLAGQTRKIDGGAGKGENGRGKK